MPRKATRRVEGGAALSPVVGPVLWPTRVRRGCWAVLSPCLIASVLSSDGDPSSPLPLPKPAARCFYLPTADPLPHRSSKKIPSNSGTAMAVGSIYQQLVNVEPIDRVLVPNLTFTHSTRPYNRAKKLRPQLERFFISPNPTSLSCCINEHRLHSC
jgi:hypothetical protein